VAEPKTTKKEVPSMSKEEPAPVVEKPPASADFETVDLFLRSWAEAWARKDVKTYLAHYSKKFQVPGGLGRKAWSAQRKRRILKPAVIEIEISNISVEKKGAAGARVRFDQRYQSDVYVDRVLKTLDLRWENDMWKIYRETSKAK
jgi:murein L,D-transpeptidase YafK